MKRFLHVGFAVTDPRVDEWKKVFDEAQDWFRYTANCWILYTARDAQAWYKRIKPHLGKGEQVFVCELNMSNRQGWMSKGAWEWIRKPR